MEAWQIILLAFIASGVLFWISTFFIIAGVVYRILLVRTSPEKWSRDCSLDDDRKYMPDSIGLFSNWYTRGPIYEMPFGSICGRRIENLYAAGRIIGADDGAWYNTRVIPICAVSGEGAGRAAAIYARDGAVDIDKLQGELRNAGVLLHIEELGIKDI